MARIVVGVDGSAQARRAVRLAVEEARLRSGDLAVLYCVPEPSLLVDPVIMPQPPRADLQAAGFRVIEETLANVDLGGARVQRIVEFGGAARALCEVAKGADLLVVGSRGRGGFRGLLLGSVAQQVAAHAPCPVMIVVPEGR